jgi:hypothetical protein
MSFTYDPNQATQKDQVRFYVGDTDSARQLMQDEEIQSLLDRMPYNTALASVLESLANKFSAYPDEYDESGRIKVSWRERGKIWMQNAKRLRDDSDVDSELTPQDNGIAVGEIGVNTNGYRPHQNGTQTWEPWSG